MTGLDTRGNVLLSTFVNKADADFLKSVQNSHGLKRDVDWREDELKPCATLSRKRACIVQQAGKRANEGEECRSCGNGNGPFKTCRVLTYGDQILFNGACGNCGFNSGGNKCSLREEAAELAGWVKSYLEKANPLHQLVRGNVPVRNRSRLILRMLANPHVLWEFQMKARGTTTLVANRTRSAKNDDKRKSKRVKKRGSRNESSKDGGDGSDSSDDDLARAGLSSTRVKHAAPIRAQPRLKVLEKGQPKERAKLTEKAGPREREAPKGKDRARRKWYFENDWLTSPLNDRSVANKKDFSRATEAYNAIPEMIEALEEARVGLKGWLIENGQLSEDEEEEEPDNDPFAAYTKKRKRTRASYS